MADEMYEQHNDVDNGVFDTAENCFSSEDVEEVEKDQTSDCSSVELHNPYEERLKEIGNRFIKVGQEIDNYFNLDEETESISDERREYHLRVAKELQGELNAVRDEFGAVFNETQFKLDEGLRRLDSKVYQGETYEIPSVHDLLKGYEEQNY